MTRFLITLSLSLASAMASTNPSQPLITNGNFRHWEDSLPTGWNTKSNVTFEQEREFTCHAPYALKAVISETGDTPSPATLSQDLVLEPETSYRLEFSMAKHSTGSVAVRVQPLKAGRLDRKEATPLNWSNIWSWRFPWKQQTLTFHTGKTPDYRLTFINYGKAGEPFWLGDIQLIREEAPADANAFELYTHSIMRPFRNEGKSATDTPLTSLTCQVTPGDYVPALVGLRARQSLSGVNLRLQSPLVSEAGDKIDPGQVVIRSIGEQALLPLARPRDVTEGTNAGWWITLKAPENAKPGIYQGSLEVSGKGTPSVTIPYQVRVEAFRLPKPNIPFFVYHADVYFPSGTLDRESRLAYYRDMKEHGMNTVTLYANPDVDGKEVDFERDYRYSALSREKLDHILKRDELSAEELEARQQYGVAPIMELIRESGLVQEGFVIPWLPIKAGNYGFGDMPSTALRKSLETWQERKEWPRPLLYVMDEPFGQPERIEAALSALRRINALNLSIPTMTANLPVKELGDQYDIWVQGSRRVTPEMALSARELQRELWTYNCNMPTENAQFTRAFFGFWAHRTRVKGVALWAYYDAKTWRMDSEGKIHGKNGPGRLSRICPSPEGPVPTISWETTREGVNDYRYAMLFEQVRANLASQESRLSAELREALPEEARKQWEASQKKASLRRSLESEWKEAGHTSWLALLEKLDRCRTAMALGDMIEDKVLLSVPYDAFAPMGEIPWSSENHRFLPTLGFGDPEIASEEKRTILGAYIRYFLAELNTVTSS